MNKKPNRLRKLLRLSLLNVKNPVGFVVSCAGSLLGTIIMLFIFVQSYTLQIGAEVTRGAHIEALLVTFILPALANLAFVGGILWTVSAYGFATGKKWSFAVALIGSVLSILAGFFPILPYASSELGFPPTAIIFASNLLFFVLLQKYEQHMDKSVLALSLLMGVAYILAFINGVASTHYIIATGGVYYIALEPLNFGASIAWGTATIAYVLRKSWISPLIVGAAAASLFGGVPIALVSQIELSRPSLFWPSPIVAVVIVVALRWLKTREKQNV